ncbi:hypothetical protein T440DRAFT_176647 [Plenodomus tracheiphilus IPT5]|uniref:Uncharacterized protein n=1 Tax=Plenodomus tracheiphilus IPT5 TaxID=1408161 RepID=A0A6A7AXT7_9PLEO|nr:hypothetical protein T440DRAFT_176647 [Plenodomus tracheiphilus IPT5]
MTAIQGAIGEMVGCTILNKANKHFSVMVRQESTSLLFTLFLPLPALQNSNKLPPSPCLQLHYLPCFDSTSIDPVSLVIFFSTVEDHYRWLVHNRACVRSLVNSFLTQTPSRHFLTLPQRILETLFPRLLNTQLSLIFFSISMQPQIHSLYNAKYTTFPPNSQNCSGSGNSMTRLRCNAVLDTLLLHAFIHSKLFSSRSTCNMRHATCNIKPVQPYSKYGFHSFRTHYRIRAW